MFLDFHSLEYGTSGRWNEPVVSEEILTCISFLMTKKREPSRIQKVFKQASNTNFSKGKKRWRKLEIRILLATFKVTW